MISAGRGFGKTRAGAEDAARFAQFHPGSRVAVIAPTYADARDTCVEGDSGLRAVLPTVSVEAWNRSLGELILVNGSRFKLFSADEPERLRGPQHHRAWCDEVGAWRYAETWDQMMFGLRLGERPRAVVTTTPRPTALIRRLLSQPGTVVSRGSTYDNAANLAPSFLTAMRDKYEGTRLGRQELRAELLDDVPGALWTRAMLDGCRVREAPHLVRVVVAVDPSGTSGNDGGDPVGIVVAGLGTDGKGYVLADWTIAASPAVWGRRVVEAFRFFKADRVVAERNFGGAMVKHVVHTADGSVPYREVTASRGKAVRAEPVAALYEQHRVRHVGAFPEMEDQMCSMTGTGYVGEGSPDRLDAGVWALTELMLGQQASTATATVTGLY